MSYHEQIANFKKIHVLTCVSSNNFVPCNKNGFLSLVVRDEYEKDSADICNYSIHQKSVNFSPMSYLEDTRKVNLPVNHSTYALRLPLRNTRKLFSIMYR